MMPGVGFMETILLVLVAVVVIGPKDLPLMMRKFGRFTGKMRAMAFEFKQGIDELGRQAELEELRKEVADLKKSTGLEDLQKDFEDEARKFETDVNKTMAPLPSPGTPAEGTPAPATMDYGALSAEDRGYDAGDLHHEGFGPNGAQAEPAAAPASLPEPAAAPQPVKQDTPA